jgi:hypothetical protein
MLGAVWMCFGGWCFGEYHPVEYVLTQSERKRIAEGVYALGAWRKIVQCRVQCSQTLVFWEHYIVSLLFLCS